MNHSKTIFVVCAALLFSSLVPVAKADPCGMVPPIYVGEGSPIARIGLQQTYVFYKDGVESFVIRPGFKGKVDNFGMLIPFPTPPALRKVPDNVFDQIANAVEPPEVVVDLRWEGMQEQNGQVFDNFSAPKSESLQMLSRDEVAVHKEEAVGMYEVAVLSAGSPKALKRWMDQNGFQYPKGMDSVTAEYIEANWCFVAVKTKVGDKASADPKPGQRNAKPEMPEGSVFDGTVQGMGFRFKTDKLVVPMRLSAFNEGDLRNIVYLLTDGPRRIRSIPEEYVVRQINGAQLVQNLTGPLPLRIIGGKVADIPKWRLEGLEKERDPDPHVSVARQLFAGDMAALSDDDLSLEHEEVEKELLAVGEHFGLRGEDIDSVNQSALKEEADLATNQFVKQLNQMTLSVVDGDFPRQVLANENLTFAEFKMPAQKNTRRGYDAKVHGPAKPQIGRRFSSYHTIDPERMVAVDVRNGQVVSEGVTSSPVAIGSSVMLLALLFGAGRRIKSTRKK